MFDSAILEVIIGMIFVYSLASILVTQINSLISVMLRLRARHLREGVQKLVRDDVIGAKILTHPLIHLIDSEIVHAKRQLSPEEATRIVKQGVNDVTWIEPGTFASVLLSLIRDDANEALFGKMEGIISEMPAGGTRRRLRLILNKLIMTGEGLQELRQAIQNIPEVIYRDTLMEALEDIEDEIGNLRLEANSVATVMVGVRKIQNESLRVALDTIIATSETMEEVEAKVVEWFNDGMNRATQAFAKNMQRVSLIAGVLIAVFINVDSVNIARTLWEDPALRANVNSLVQATDIATLEEQLARAQARLDALNAGGDGSGEVADDDLEAIVAELFQSSAEVNATLVNLLDLRIPMGWYYEDLSGQEDSSTYPLKINDSTNLWNLNPFNGNPNWVSLILAKLIGWGATVIAIAQGAPFWFNLLRRVMK